MSKKRSYSVSFPQAAVAEELMNWRFSKRYRRDAAVIRRAQRNLNPFRRRGNAPTAASIPSGSGYSIHPRRAINTKKRRPSRRRRMNRLRRRKIVNAAVAGKLLTKVYKKLSFVNEIELGRGRVAVLNRNIFPTNTIHFLPLHLYDLTCGGHQVPISYQLGFARGVTGPNAKQYFWNGYVHVKANQDGENTTNVDQYRPSSGVAAEGEVQVIDSSDMSVAAWSTTKKAFEHDMNVDLMMYGKKSKDTLYRVDIVMFDQAIVEYGLASEDNAPPASHRAIDNKEWNAFWHSLVAPYTQNPLAKFPRGKFVKILKSYKFRIPEQSGDLEQIPCVKTKIKVKMNRIRDFFWKKYYSEAAEPVTEFDPEEGTNLEDRPEANDWTTQTNNGFLHPRKRVFMMIRATNTELNATPDTNNLFNLNPGDMPTYDIRLRGSYSVI